MSSSTKHHMPGHIGDKRHAQGDQLPGPLKRKRGLPTSTPGPSGHREPIATLEQAASRLRVAIEKAWSLLPFNLEGSKGASEEFECGLVSIELELSLGGGLEHEKSIKFGLAHGTELGSKPAHGVPAHGGHESDLQFAVEQDVGKLKHAVLKVAGGVSMKDITSAWRKRSAKDLMRHFEVGLSTEWEKRHGPVKASITPGVKIGRYPFFGEFYFGLVYPISHTTTVQGGIKAKISVGPSKEVILGWLESESAELSEDAIADLIGAEVLVVLFAAAVVTVSAFALGKMLDNAKSTGEKQSLAYNYAIAYVTTVFVRPDERNQYCDINVSVQTAQDMTPQNALSVKAARQEGARQAVADARRQFQSKAEDRALRAFSKCLAFQRNTTRSIAAKAVLWDIYKHQCEHSKVPIDKGSFDALVAHLTFYADRLI